MIIRSCLALVLCLPLVAVELEFSTFFGGEQSEQANSVALDPDGNIYVLGQTRTLTPTPGALYAVSGSSFDIFVLKLNPNGSQILYLAVFGGSAGELGTSIAVDDEGAAYVTGWTFSEDFPVTDGAAQTTFGGGSRDAFVAKLAPDGSRFVYATYLGGSAFEDGTGVAVDGVGRAVVVGTTGSSDFITTPDALELGRPTTGRSAYVARLSPDGSALEWSALLGGSARDEANAVALDDDGAVWIVGYTTSADFPTTPGAYQRGPRGADDSFVARLSPEGDALEAATRLGGSTCVQTIGAVPCDLARAITLDFGRPVVAGNTLGQDFPVTDGSVWNGGTAAGDAFVAVFDRDLTTLALSTLIGGASEDQATGVATDLSGAIFVSGSTGSRNFPTTPDAFQRQYRDREEAFVARIAPDSGALLYSTFLGGSSNDRALAIASDGRGAVVIAGDTGSTDFPTTAGAVQEQYTDLLADGGEAIIAKFRFDLQPRLSAAGVVNAASLRPGVVAPGQIISIFGRAVGPEEPVGLELVDGRAGVTLGGVRVLVNGVAAPLLFVSLNQINAAVPYAAAALPVASLEVERNGARSAPVTLRVEASAPAIFSLDGSGLGQGAILNQDFSVNGPGNRIRRGEIVILFATGEGLTAPPGVDGAPAAEPLPQPVSQIAVSIDGLNADVLYAGGAPGLVAGVLQLNARVPATARSGAAVPVSFTAAGRRSPAGVTLAIE